MEMADPLSYPGKLPAPVKLIGPEDGTIVNVSGALLSCERSENAISYQLLFGKHPQQMNYTVSTTTTPPRETITDFPYTKTFWTIKIEDLYGSTIHADPICIYYDDKQQTPHLKITHPKSGSVLRGLVSVLINATDKSGILKVEFYLDKVIKHTSFQAPFIFNWDTIPCTNSGHTLEVRAFNKKGLSTSAWSVVEISNMAINLQIKKTYDHSLLQRKMLSQIEFSVENPANIPISTYIILRSVSGKFYKKIEEISSTELINETFTIYDKYLDNNELYQYKVVAIDLTGMEISVSNIVSI
jgi:hypothetical protein